MPVRIITLEREYGSGGANIAKQIADRLGWKLWDQEITAEIARASISKRSENSLASSFTATMRPSRVSVAL